MDKRKLKKSSIIMNIIRLIISAGAVVAIGIHHGPFIGILAGILFIFMELTAWHIHNINIKTHAQSIVSIACYERIEKIEKFLATDLHKHLEEHNKKIINIFYKEWTKNMDAEIQMRVMNAIHMIYATSLNPDKDKQI